MRRGLASLAFAVVLLTGGAASAQATPGERFAALFFDIGMRPAMAQLANDQRFGIGSEMGIPEWDPLFHAAFTEEMEADTPALSRLFGRGFDRRFTAQELEAGISLLSSEAGRRLVTSGAQGETTAPTLTPQAQREFDRLSRQPGARSFMTKFGDLDMSDLVSERDMLKELMPGVLRRFADKAEAEARQTQR